MNKLKRSLISDLSTSQLMYLSMIKLRLKFATERWMQKMLKEVFLGPTCQVLQVAFGDLRLSWVQQQI